MTKEEAYKKYLHLYVGSDAQITISGVTGGISICTSNIVGTHGVYSMPFSSVETLYLRPLSSMTDAEALEYCQFMAPYLTTAKIIKGNIHYGWNGGQRMQHNPFRLSNPEQFTWLLENGFDVFGLIEQGHAKELA